MCSHCIINQLAVVKGEKRAAGAFPFVKILIDKGIGIIQMPCPEMNELGPDRLPMSYEDYNQIQGYRERCQIWLSPIFKQIQQYLAQGDHFIGIIGIHQSPNCSISNQRGVYMEIIFEWLKTQGLEVPFIEVPTDYCEGDEGKFSNEIEAFIKGGKNEK